MAQGPYERQSGVDVAGILEKVHYLKYYLTYRVIIKSSMTSMYHTRHPSLALEPFVMSMYPTEHPNLSVEPSMTSMYHTRHPS
jgi:hypothetical protein